MDVETTSGQPEGWDEKTEDEQIEMIKDAQESGELPVDEPVEEEAPKPTATLTQPDGAPQDPITWARVGGENSWHIVDSYTRAGSIALDGKTMLWPEYRPDLGAEKSCEVCMRIYMQRKDL